MFEVKNPGKKIKEICASLGEPYKVTPFDGENVVYRDLGNGFDFEVSGLDNTRKTFNATLYIWQTNNGTKIVETVPNISSLEKLKDCLDKSADKYLKINPTA